jgi:hypothetical protein
VRLRFDVMARLPPRPRSTKANLYVQENLEELRRDLMKERGRLKLSSREDRCVNE